MLIKLGPEDRPEALIPQAMAVACSLGRSVCLIETLIGTSPSTEPIDPVDWELRRCAARTRLDALVKRFRSNTCELDFRVLDNFSVEGVDESRTLLGVSRRNNGLPWHIDELTRRFLLAGGEAILVVPDRIPDSLPVQFGRVMVPLDGSPRAECALPGALAIARHHDAELLLVYASPELPVIPQGPPDKEAVALAETLKVRNTRMAGAYLAEVRARCAHAQVALRTVLLDAGDVRRLLVDAVSSESVDLLVIAARGAGGHQDVMSGSVASFLIEHADVPVFMVNQATVLGDPAIYDEIEVAGLRHPDVPVSST